jgi:hypothetical protein
MLPAGYTGGETVGSGMQDTTSGRHSAGNILNALEGVCYCADFAGNIIAVGERNWDEFATVNGAGESFLSSSIQGKNLFDIIAGDDVVHAYRQIFDDLRSGKEREISFTFRCDSPSVRREMRMCVSCIREDMPEAVLFQSLVLDERQRPPVSLFDPDRLRKMMASERKLPILSICSYCHSVRLDQAWVTPEEYYAAGGTGEVRLSHGICPSCYAEKKVRGFGPSS